VTITTDRITLDGQGSAVLNGAGGGPAEFNGVVTIDGARGVTLTGLTIQNGAGEGILGLHGAAFAVRNSTVQDNAGTGIAVGDGSTADLTDCTMQRNGLGLDVVTNSSAILRGAINITNNGSGMDVNGSSFLEIRGAQVQVNNNRAGGISAGSGGGLAIFGWSEAQGSTLIVDGNGGSGILLADATLSVFGGRFFGSGANTIRVSNNMVNGIWLPANGAISSPFATAKFVIENNPTGLNFGGGSGATFIGGLTVRNNKTGVLAEGADLTVVSIPPNPSTIKGNDADLNLSFGTRATFGGVTIGTMTCDGTVMSRGSTVCR
jgi:hypothetical protein